MPRKSSKIANKIRYLRESAGMTQLELAESANLDLTTVNRIENRVSEPSVMSLRKLAKVFKISLSGLLAE